MSHAVFLKGKCEQCSLFQGICSDFNENKANLSMGARYHMFITDICIIAMVVQAQRD